MNDMGYLVNADRGNPDHMTWMGNTIFTMPHIRAHRSLSGSAARRTITSLESAASG